MLHFDPRSDLCETGLNYVVDASDGITRRKSGTGFTYRRNGTDKVSDTETLERIRMLAIPPAWTDVWICGDPMGHLQATGIDSRGRKQYRYHPKWTELRDADKYGGLVDFAHGLPALRDMVSQDLSGRGVTREKVLASVVWLLDHTMIRVGNHAYARDNKSFGLTTLRSKHVEIKGDKVRFEFRGKSGKDWRLTLVDRRIARIMRSIQELPGQHLLQYLDDHGERRTVTSTDVNSYIQSHAGLGFSSKDFRTWGGTVRALSILAALEVPTTQSGQRKALNAAIDQVAARLGNTRSVCRKCYIHPAVVESWERGELGGQVKALRGGKLRKGLDDEESLALRWLERHAASAEA